MARPRFRTALKQAHGACTAQQGRHGSVSPRGPTGQGIAAPTWAVYVSRPVRAFAHRSLLVPEWLRQHIGEMRSCAERVRGQGGSRRCAVSPPLPWRHLAQLALRTARSPSTIQFENKTEINAPVVPFHFHQDALHTTQAEQAAAGVEHSAATRLAAGCSLQAAAFGRPGTHAGCSNHTSNRGRVAEVLRCMQPSLPPCCMHVSHRAAMASPSETGCPCGRRCVWGQRGTLVGWCSGGSWQASRGGAARQPSALQLLHSRGAADTADALHCRQAPPVSAACRTCVCQPFQPMSASIHTSRTYM